MRPFAAIFLIFSVFVGSVPILAQDTPVAPPTATLSPILPATETPPPPPPLPTATALPDINLLLPSDDQIGQMLLAVRNDIEVLANATLGPSNRPVGWSGTYDLNDPEMILKARLDLDNLTNQITTEPPPGWFGIQATTAYSITRDIRHDLELLADAVVGLNVRPPNWAGDAPIMRCDRATQTLVMLLQTRGLLTPSAVPGSPTYCRDLAIEASVYAEVNLLNRGIAAPQNLPAPVNGEVSPPPVTPPSEPAEPASTVTVSITGAAAFGYLDRGAETSAGVIPTGTLVVPVARSYAQFSRMTLVRGEGFEVFMDYQDTSLDASAFEALPNVDSVPVNLFCNAEWCQQ